MNRRSGARNLNFTKQIRNETIGGKMKRLREYFEVNNSVDEEIVMKKMKKQQVKVKNNIILPEKKKKLQ